MFCSGIGTPTVVLESALAGPTILWQHVQPLIATGTRVCSYDRDGIGWSQESGQPRTMRGYVEDLHRALASLGEAAPFVLVGHSLGRILTADYARAYPNEVAGMVLLDPAEGRQFRYGSDDEWLSHTEALPFFRLGLTAARRGLAREAFWLSDKLKPLPLPAPTRNAYIALASSVKGMTAMRAEAEALFRVSKESEIPPVLGSKPLLLLSAAKTLEEGYPAFHDAYAHMSTIGVRRTVANSSHSGLVLNPGPAHVVAQAVLEVVEQVRDRGARRSPALSARPVHPAAAVPFREIGLRTVGLETRRQGETSTAAAIAARSPIRTSPNGTWSGAVRDADGDWKLSVSFRSTTEDAAVADVDFPDVDGYARRFTVTSNGSKLHLERGQPNGRAITLDADVRADSMLGTFAGLGITAPFVLRRTATPPQVVVESTTFTNGSIQLAGSIYRPAAPGSHPAVVEIHGGGPDTRANYESKAIFLARHGITTLIYDKRGTGQSSGDWETASMEDLARDALAGVAMLRRLKYVNPKRVGVEGFSQGGWIAPLAASLDARIAFVVVGSASGINPMEQSIFQVQNEMRAAGDPDSIVALAVMLRQRLYAKLPCVENRVKRSARNCVLSSHDAMVRTIGLAGLIERVDTERRGGIAALRA